MPIALITGISGQDGSYLTELLLSKGYKIYNPEIIFLEADLSNAESILKAVSESQPNEFYNLAAISSVAASWKDPYTTTLINSIGVVNCLEAIRKINPKIKFFQAGSSEEFGEAESSPQNEKTPLNPINPYACSKTFAHEIIKSYKYYSKNKIKQRKKINFRKYGRQKRLGSCKRLCRSHVVNASTTNSRR